MTSSGMQWTKVEPGHVSPKIDTGTANVARMYDYYLGGKDNFEADRIAAEQVLAQLPGQRRSALENRRFLRRAVGFLAGQAGIDQFLDIGVGLPTQGAVHEVAHEINPRSRVAYVDYDPVVVAHANALLATPDQSVVVAEDIRRPRELLANPVIRGHLDFDRPIAVLVLAIFHFVRDEDDPAAITACLREALAPGSYLVLSVGRADGDEAERGFGAYSSGHVTAYNHSVADFSSFFGSLPLVAPGIADARLWHPEPALTEPLPPRAGQSLVGVARIG